MLSRAIEPVVARVLGRQAIQVALQEAVSLAAQEGVVASAAAKHAIPGFAIGYVVPAAAQYQVSFLHDCPSLVRCPECLVPGWFVPAA